MSIPVTGNRHWSLSLLAIGSATGLALVGGAWPTSAGTATTPGWRVVVRTNASLNTIVAPAASAAWALGAKTGPDYTARPFGLRWNGHRWSDVTFPAAMKSGIGCAGASSPSNVWAFAGTSAFGGFADYSGALRLAGGKVPGTRSMLAIVGIYNYKLTFELRSEILAFGRLPS